MPAVTINPISNLNVKQGEVLIEQGSNANTLIFLHQGKAVLCIRSSSNGIPNANKSIFSIQSPSIVEPHLLCWGGLIIIQS